MDRYSLALFRPIVDINNERCIAIVGDTHHGEKCLTIVIDWLNKNSIRKVILKQTAHQKKLFEMAGFDTEIFPHYAHDPILIEPSRIIYIEQYSQDRQEMLTQEETGY